MSVKPSTPHKPHGTVVGDPRFAFEQDGQLYSAQHEPVDADGKVIELAAAVVEAAAPAPAAPAPAANPDDDIPADEKVDLKAWATGDPSAAATPWQSVRAAAATVLEDITELKSKESLKGAPLAHYGLAA